MDCIVLHSLITNPLACPARYALPLNGCAACGILVLSGAEVSAALRYALCSMLFAWYIYTGEEKGETD